jgi:hypothetical protein
MTVKKNYLRDYDIVDEDFIDRRNLDKPKRPVKNLKKAWMEYSDTDTDEDFEDLLHRRR